MLRVFAFTPADRVLRREMAESSPLSDAHWSRILGLCRVPGAPAVFILGSFARRVTFYAQQVRALNLIDVLCKAGEVHQGSQIAIVGAGVAGATAAVAAARRGLRVTLFEKHRDNEDNTMVIPRQRLTDERAVHPFVYDWPVGQLDRRANLPLMDWAEGTAAQVVESLAKKFVEDQQPAKEKAEHPPRITLVQADVDEKMLLMSGHPVVLDVPRVGRHEFDALILAVGFGDELGQSYWDNDGLQSKKGEWLVSGTGDGGLTDLMRLCIDNFRHAEVVRTFGAHGREAAQRLISADADSDRAGRVALYKQVASVIAEQLRSDRLDLGLRDVRVWLAGTEEIVFSAGASILNRLITAYLVGRKAFAFIPHSVVTPTQWLQNGRVKVVYTDDRKTLTPVDDPTVPSEFDGVVIRHGTKSALVRSFPTLLAKQARALKRKWDDMPPEDDPTRRVLWGEKDFDHDALPPLDINDRMGPFVVVVEGPAQPEADASSTLTRLAESALLRTVDSGATPPRIETIKPEGDLSTAHGYRRVLRALCRSELAIFDITGMPPATLLLLGIRSVVRRGITLATLRVDRSTTGMPPPFDIPELPFNIRETSVIARRDDDDDFSQALSESIIEGRNQLQLLAQEYQDMPAYDNVRRLGPRPEAYRPIAPADGVLVLTSYQKDYLTKRPGNILKNVLGTVLPKKKYVWQRIVQSASPQLASQKLYAAIRRTQMCVFDWTQWRPNLFFELGVRLAASETMPVSLVYRESLMERGPERQIVVELFAPFAYDADNQNSDLRTLLQGHLKAIETAAPVPRASVLSPGFTFREVQRWTDVTSEAPMRVDLALEREATALVGPDLKMYTEVPLLYRDNDTLMRQAQIAALDRWLAAWYFLDKRYGIWKQILAADTLPDDSNVQRWVKLATDIQAMMEALGLRDYTDIKHEIDEVVRTCVARG